MVLTDDTRGNALTALAMGGAVVLLGVLVWIFPSNWKILLLAPLLWIGQGAIGIRGYRRGREELEDDSYSRREAAAIARWSTLSLVIGVFGFVPLLLAVLGVVLALQGLSGMMN